MKNFILLAVSSILLVDLLPTYFEHNVDLSRAINVNGVSFNSVDTSSLGAAQVRQSASRGRGLGEKPKEGADKEKKKEKEKEEEPKKPNENKLKQPQGNGGAGQAQPQGNGGAGQAQPEGNREAPAQPQGNGGAGQAQPQKNEGGNAGARKGQGQNNQGANAPNEKVVNDYLQKIRSSVTTEWTPCSVTCGNGVRIRRRAHADKKKAEDLTMDDLEVEACVMDKCAGIFNVVSNSLGLVISLVLALFN
uniref:Circumsporozoite protein n=1 Tax=Plasmodium knowlesi TaxID=5850 RepID=H9C3Q7_PLAKN|nr:circumsporozoite protein [Plasmodium knowlesi]